MARNTTTTPPDLEAALLEELEAETITEVPVATELTPRELEVAKLLRERDHLDGCPVIGNPGYRGSARVEAYAESIIAPQPVTRSLGLGKGDVVVVAHCMECGAQRYFAPPAGATLANAVGRLLARIIRDRRGENPDGTEAELDTEL